MTDNNPSLPSESTTIWLRRLRRVIAWAGFIYFLALCMLVAFETALVYPRPDAQLGDWNPSEIEYEDVTFASSDGTQLHGWYLDHAQPERYILFFHGNGEHIGYLGEEMDALRDYYSASVFVFDFRGYGKSEGSPHEAGLLADGIAAQTWLAARAGIQPNQIILYGRSLGGGVAVATAANTGAEALVLDRTFHSMVDIAADMYRWAPVRLLMRNRYPSAQRIADYHGPLYQMHGTADEIVPFHSGKQLFDACPAQRKTFLQVPGLMHNDPAPQQWYDGLSAFFDTIAADAALSSRESPEE